MQTNNVLIFFPKKETSACCACCPVITGKACPLKLLVADLQDRLIRLLEDED